MASIKSFLRRLMGVEENSIKVPPGRSSSPDISQSFLSISNSLEFIEPGFEYEHIPVVRKLYKVNSSVSSAATTIVELANTGHKLKFGPGTKPETQFKIRKHLDAVAKSWVPGGVGLHSAINKMILQIYIGGAISTEAVVKRDLSGVKQIAFLNPENIRVAYNHSKEIYEFFQYQLGGLNPTIFKTTKVQTHKDLYTKLNPVTYKYYGLFSDEESPVGTPPFLSAFDDINAQLKMLKNIGYVSDQLGIMGFLEVLMEKPGKVDGESTPAYRGRLIAYLNEAKTNIKDGIKDGIVTGYKDDHEFNFHSTTKDINGVGEIFAINQKMVSNGLFTPPQFLGGSESGAETSVNIVFTKMLSQLFNIQIHISEALENFINLELRLAGFDYDYVNVEFNSSTITDRLKLAQAKEIEIRNSRVLYADGIISQEEYAVDTGHDKPDKKEPRVPIDPAKIAEGEAKRKEHEKKSDTSDRKSRDKAKPQPRRNDQKSKST